MGGGNYETNKGLLNKEKIKEKKGRQVKPYLG